MHALNENIMRNIRVKSLQEQEKQIHIWIANVM